MKHRILYISVFILFILPYIYSQPMSPEQVYEKVSPAVVQLIAYDADSSIMAWGSAVAIGDSGIFYTNMHIFSGAKRLEIVSQKILISDVKVVGFDPDKDILILRSSESSIRGVMCFNSDSLKVGEVVYALGNPQGYLNTFSGGLLSGIRDDHIIQLQYTASISPGSSGGALLNSKGELIGITSSYFKEGQNLNFAVPVDYFMNTSTINVYDSNEINLMSRIVEVYNAQSKLNEDSVCINFSKYMMDKINNRNSLFTAANMLYNRHSPDEALNLCNMGLSKFGDDKDFYLLRAKLFNSLNKKDSSLMDFNKSIELDPANENSLYDRAMFLRDEIKDYHRAAADLQKIVNTHQNCEKVYLDLAGIYLILRDTVEAIKFIQKSYYGNIQTEYMYYERGMMLSNIGLNQEAADNYTWALTFDPSKESYYFSRGIEYSKDDRPDKALTDYLKVLSINPVQKSALVNTAYSYFGLRDYDEAEKYFLKAIKVDPRSFDSYIGLAITYDKLNKTRSCLLSMSEAISIKPVLGKGIAGLDSVKTEGYFWSSMEEKCIREVFVKMRIEDELQTTDRHGRRSNPSGATRRKTHIDLSN